MQTDAHRHPLPAASPTDRVAARRLARAAALADTALALFARGMTGINLRQRILAGRPYDLASGADGHSLRLYGLQTPPCRSETAAILCWAQMAEGCTPLPAASLCDAPAGQRAPAQRGR